MNLGKRIPLWGVGNSQKRLLPNSIQDAEIKGNVTLTLNPNIGVSILLVHLWEEKYAAALMFARKTYSKHFVLLAFFWG